MGRKPGQEGHTTAGTKASSATLEAQPWAQLLRAPFDSWPGAETMIPPCRAPLEGALGNDKPEQGGGKEVLMAISRTASLEQKIFLSQEQG